MDGGRWTLTPDMIKRELERNRGWACGMAGGTDHPLGAPLSVLFDDRTNEPETIGTAVSSGGIRMMSRDVIGLCGRVPAGSQAVVL